MFSFNRWLSLVFLGWPAGCNGARFLTAVLNERVENVLSTVVERDRIGSCNDCVLHGLAAQVLSVSNSAQLAQQNLLPYCVLYSVQLHGLVKGNVCKALPSYTKRDSLI